MIRWIFEHLGVVVFLAILLSQVFRAFLKARRAQEENKTTGGDDAEARRMREVQEQIRRRIAERKGGAARTEAPPPVVSTQAPPVARPQTTQLPELFGGPLGRMLEELQKKTQAPAAPPVVDRRRGAEVERQEQLAEQIRLVEEQKVLTQRRAAHLAAEKRAVAESEGALLTVARSHVLDDLRDPQTLRRAFVLREVLGPPVAMR